MTLLTGRWCGNDSENQHAALLYCKRCGLKKTNTHTEQKKRTAAPASQPLGVTSQKGCRSPGMACQQKLLSLWVWLLLMAALCPGAQYVYSKRGGGGFRGKGKGDGNKESPSHSRGLSKQGLKWAGAAAAGVLGGTGTGYGLGFLGRPKHAPGKHYGHKTSSSEQDQRLYRNEGQGYRNQSLWRAFVNTAAPAPTNNIFLVVGHVVSFLIAAWIRDI